MTFSFWCVSGSLEKSWNVILFYFIFLLYFILFFFYILFFLCCLFYSNFLVFPIHKLYLGDPPRKIKFEFHFSNFRAFWPHLDDLCKLHHSHAHVVDSSCNATNWINQCFLIHWFICGSMTQYPHWPPQISTGHCQQLPRLTHTSATLAIYLATFRPF